MRRDRDRVSVAGTFHVRSGIIAFGTALTNAGMGDINLYRKSANELALESGDSLTIPGTATVGGVFTASGGVITKEAIGAVAVTTLGTVGCIQVQVCGGTPRIVFRATGTTYFIDRTG